MTHLWPRMVAAVRNRFRTTVGKRFSRFMVAAVAAVIASQTTLAVCLGVAGWTAGKSALTAWLAGAGTSYLVSRWAWERRGRPHLLKETIPFWIVAVGAAIVLTTTTKFANQRGIALGLSHTQKLIFVGSAYFAANCATFVTRFVIFHYVLFKDRQARQAVPPATAGSAVSPGAPSGLGEARGPGPSPGTAPPTALLPEVNGSAAWAANGSLRGSPHDPPAEPGVVPEPGTRR